MLELSQLFYSPNLSTLFSCKLEFSQRKRPLRRAYRKFPWITDSGLAIPQGGVWNLGETGGMGPRWKDFSKRVQHRGSVGRTVEKSEYHQWGPKHLPSLFTWLWWLPKMAPCWTATGWRQHYFLPEENVLEKILDQVHLRKNGLLIPGNPMALSERQPRSWKSPEYSAQTKEDGLRWSTLSPGGNDQGWEEGDAVKCRWKSWAARSHLQVSMKCFKPNFLFWGWVIMVFAIYLYVLLKGSSSLKVLFKTTHWRQWS